MQVEIENCIFRDNVSVHEGGAIYVYYGLPRFRDSWFLDNRATRGGAIFTDGGDFHMERCVFGGNVADEGGAIHAHVAYADTFSSCTFFGNTASVASGLYLDSYSNQTTVVTNCIIAGGHGGAGFVWEGAGDLQVACTDIHGNEGGDWVDALEGLEGQDGNISTDPILCGDANPDDPWSIDMNSPCNPLANPDCGLIGARPVGCDFARVAIAARPHRIAGAYPNPFNPSTTVVFELGRDATVSLDVFDLSGRAVRRLIRPRPMPAGRHESGWDGTDSAGRNVAAGVYFCRLIADEVVATGRLVLIK